MVGWVKSGCKILCKGDPEAVVVYEMRSKGWNERKDARVCAWQEDEEG